MSSSERANAGVIPSISLGTRLELARKHAGLTQDQLGKILGPERSAISRIESGKQLPSRADVIVWALACGVDFEWLAGSDFPPLQRRDQGGGTSTICNAELPWRHSAWRATSLDLVS